jgi:3-hydroxymyristoyl/3-hydroxydecanoyl-(acyl carrier protein) dehydratase
MPMPAPAVPTSSGLIDLDQTFIPIGHMRQIARVTRIQDASISGEMELSSRHWVWPEHFPRDPIFPGTLMLEAAGQLVALWAWAKGVRGRPRLVRISGSFTSPVDPGTSSLLLEAEIQRKRAVFFGGVRVSSEVADVAAVELALIVLPD